MADSIDIHRVRSITVEPARQLDGTNSYVLNIHVETERAYFSIGLFSASADALAMGPAPEFRAAAHRLAGTAEAFRVAEAACHPDAAKCAGELDAAINNFRSAVRSGEGEEAA